MQRFTSILWSYFNAFLSLAYPNVCCGCGISLKGSEVILCRKCTSNLPRTGFEWSENNLTYQSFWGRTPVTFAASAYYYRKGELLPKLIHLLKYKNRRDVGLFLGETTGQLILQSPFFKSLDFIIPVPLHPRKLRSRGFNQCELLASGLSEKLKIPTASNLLIREVYNPSQTRKTRFERWENVSGIFSAPNPELLINKHILLVDDVITTGSTLEACCLPLTQIQGTRISIITIGYSNH